MTAREAIAEMKDQAAWDSSGGGRPETAKRFRTWAAAIEAELDAKEAVCEVLREELRIERDLAIDLGVDVRKDRAQLVLMALEGERHE